MSGVDLAAALKAQGIHASSAALNALLEQGARQRWSAAETLEQLMLLVRREREAANLARRSQAATLGTVPPLDGFDWNHPRQIDRGLYESLLGMDFLGSAQNVLLRGPSGVGKTMLAQNLGLRALQRGQTVRFVTLAGCIADLLRQESHPALERRLRRYTAPSLLIVDEIGYLPCEVRAADLLFQIISRRHEKRSTVITTNLPFKQWGSIFPGAACVTALLDRFVQHCHVLDIDADSWRQRPSRTRRLAE